MLTFWKTPWHYNGMNNQENFPSKFPSGEEEDQPPDTEEGAQKTGLSRRRFLGVMGTLGAATVAATVGVPKLKKEAEQHNEYSREESLEDTAERLQWPSRLIWKLSSGTMELRQISFGNTVDDIQEITEQTRPRYNEKLKLQSEVSGIFPVLEVIEVDEHTYVKIGEPLFGTVELPDNNAFPVWVEEDSRVENKRTGALGCIVEPVVLKRLQSSHKFMIEMFDTMRQPEARQDPVVANHLTRVQRELFSLLSGRELPPNTTAQNIQQQADTLGPKRVELLNTTRGYLSGLEEVDFSAWLENGENWQKFFEKQLADRRRYRCADKEYITVGLNELP